MPTPLAPDLPRCLYLEDASPPLDVTPLADGSRVATVIIGGGYTGLSSVRSLRAISSILLGMRRDCGPGLPAFAGHIGGMDSWP